MAKRTIYECDICKNECHKGNINIFTRKGFGFWGEVLQRPDFYICDYCLKNITDKKKEV